MTTTTALHDFPSSFLGPRVRLLHAAEEGDFAGDESGEGSTEWKRARPQHWTEITLHFADGSGLISRWLLDHAEQAGSPTIMSIEAATAEHLRALFELRSAGGSTNWYTNASLDPAAAPTAADIDWSNFPEDAHRNG